MKTLKWEFGSKSEAIPVAVSFFNVFLNTMTTAKSQKQVTVWRIGGKVSKIQKQAGRPAKTVKKISKTSGIKFVPAACFVVIFP